MKESLEARVDTGLFGAEGGGEKVGEGFF